MRRRGLNERRPVRLLESSMHGGVGEGNIAAVEAAQAKASEALDKTRIPREMAEYVKGYIDSLTPERQ